MTDARTHYADHLAAIYAWSLGGAERAIEEAGGWLATLPLPRTGARVLDLGAGFGATAIPLARAGHRVVAVDSSAELLAELSTHAGGARVETVVADLLAFVGAEPPRAWDVVLCVGDTLPHLTALADVEALVRELARVLVPGGLAIVAYRPRRELAVSERFVLVRADARRSLIAVLEPIDDVHLRVWDLIHERDGERATLKASGYHKLRLEPSWLAARAADHGFAVEVLAPYRGMVVQRLHRAT